MKKHAPLLFCICFAIVCSYISLQAGIIQAVIPQVVPTGNKRGNATVFQLAASTATASAGTPFCDDGNGNTTTSGCSGGGGGGASTINLIQGIGVRGSTTLVFGNNVTSGNAIVVGLGWESGAGTPSSISDSISTSYTKLVELTGAGNTENCALYVGLAALSGADTISATLPSGAGFYGVHAGEFLNVTATADTTGQSGSVNPGAFIPSFEITTATDLDLIVAIVQSVNSGTLSLGLGSTAVALTFGSDAGGLFFLIQNKAGINAFPVQANNSGALSGCMAALKHS